MSGLCRASRCVPLDMFSHFPHNPLPPSRQTRRRHKTTDRAEQPALPYGDAVGGAAFGLRALTRLSRPSRTIRDVCSTVSHSTDRTCLYQTDANLAARGLGAKLSMKDTRKLLHPAPGEHARRDDPQANPFGFRIKLLIMHCVLMLARRFLDGVVHRSLSTPAPKWS